MLGKRKNLKISAILAFTTPTPDPICNQIIILVLVKAGLRAGEIASLTRKMVVDPCGNFGFAIALECQTANVR